MKEWSWNFVFSSFFWWEVMHSARSQLWRFRNLVRHWRRGEGWCVRRKYYKQIRVFSRRQWYRVTMGKQNIGTTIYILLFDMWIQYLPANFASWWLFLFIAIFKPVGRSVMYGVGTFLFCWCLIELIELKIGLYTESEIEGRLNCYWKYRGPLRVSINLRITMKWFLWEFRYNSCFFWQSWNR